VLQTLLTREMGCCNSKKDGKSAKDVLFEADAEFESQV
jgi:hypothetical protein